MNVSADPGGQLLVSGGFTFFTDRLKARLGFDATLANSLEIVDDKLTGRVLPPIVDASAKAATFASMRAQHRADGGIAVAIGDGANDLPMLEAAGLGIAFHAKPAVASASRWRLDHADLTALLYAQGYRKSEIVAS